jgi:hypothetical protein
MKVYTRKVDCVRYALYFKRGLIMHGNSLNLIENFYNKFRQYTENNRMHFHSTSLRIKAPTCFEHTHTQEELNKRHVVYCVCIMSVGCNTGAVKLQPCHSQLTLYASNTPNAVCGAPPEDE